MGYDKIIKTINNMQEGKISSLECIRKLVTLSYEYNIENDDLFISIRGIDSQTDHLPIVNNDMNKLDKNYILNIKKEEEMYLDEINELCMKVLINY